MKAFGTLSSNAFERSRRADLAARPAGTARSRFVLGATTAVTLAVSLVCTAAQEDKAACVNAYEQAQRLRKAVKLVEAEAELSTCQQACPATLRADCQLWLTDTEQRIPTLALTARDPHGRPATVRVVIDEHVLPAVPDGRPLAVDPGPHVLRFEAEGAQPVTLELTARESEKNRAVTVDLQPAAGPTSSAQPAADNRSPAGLFVAGGLAAVGLVGVGYFSIARANDLGALAQCKPSCADTDVRNANLDLYLAGASLVVALTGAGGVAYYLLRAAVEPDKPAAGGHGLVLGLEPGPHGLGATLGARF